MDNLLPNIILINIFILIQKNNSSVVQAVKSMAYLVVGKNTNDIFSKFGEFWRALTSESQLRWVGFYS